ASHDRRGGDARLEDAAWAWATTVPHAPTARHSVPRDVFAAYLPYATPSGSRACSNRPHPSGRGAADRDVVSVLWFPNDVLSPVRVSPAEISMSSCRMICPC